MASPTRNDWETFRNVRHEDKVNILYYYLCEGYNMKEVAEHILGDYNSHAPQRVSNVTRCYGFSDRNSGRYRKYKLTIDDINEFVSMYPNGCDSDSIMTAFVEECARRKLGHMERQMIKPNGVLDVPLDMGGFQSQNEVISNSGIADTNDYRNHSDSQGGSGCGGWLFYIVIAMVAMFFFSDKTASILGSLLPYIILIGVLVVVVKWIKNLVSGLHFEFSGPGLVWAIICFLIAKSMWESSESGVAIVTAIIIGCCGFLKKY